MKKRIYCYLLTVVAAVLFSGGAVAQKLTPVSKYYSPFYQSPFYWDYTGDGKLEKLVRRPPIKDKDYSSIYCTSWTGIDFSYDYNGALVFKNDNELDEYLKKYVVTDSEIYPILVADFNNDGRGDIIYRNSQWSSGEQYMLLSGETGYTSVGLPLPSTGGLQLLAVDINRDGRLDIFTYESGLPIAYIQMANGSFKRQAISLITDEKELAAAIFSLNRFSVNLGDK